MAEIAGKLYSIGTTVFGLRDAPLQKQIAAVGEEIAAADEQLEEMYARLGTVLPSALMSQLRGLAPNEQAAFLQTLLSSQTVYNRPDTRAALEDAIRLAQKRNLLEQEHIRQQEELAKRQEELAKLEEERARLDFLKTQIELLDIIRENDLDTSILDGLELGLNANMSDIIAAMTAAVRQLVDRTNEELGIASPSKVFREIGENVMAGLAEGLEQTRAVNGRVRDAVGRISGLGLAEAGRVSGRVRSAAPTPAAAAAMAAQTVYIYGGLHQTVPDGKPANGLRDLYYQNLMYPGG